MMNVRELSWTALCNSPSSWFCGGTSASPRISATRAPRYRCKTCKLLPWSSQVLAQLATLPRPQYPAKFSPVLASPQSSPAQLAPTSFLHSEIWSRYARRADAASTCCNCYLRRCVCPDTKMCANGKGNQQHTCKKRRAPPDACHTRTSPPLRYSPPRIRP